MITTKKKNNKLMNKPARQSRSNVSNVDGETEHNSGWFNRWRENGCNKHTNKSAIPFGTTNKMYSSKSKSRFFKELN